MIQNVDPEPEGGPKGVPVLGVQKGVQFQGPQGDLVWGVHALYNPAIQ